MTGIEYKYIDVVISGFSKQQLCQAATALKLLFLAVWLCMSDEWGSQWPTISALEDKQQVVIVNPYICLLHYECLVAH